MSSTRFKKRAVVAAVTAVCVVLLSACAREASREEWSKATEGYIVDTNKLFVVDCLLPGQVRQLGAQMTYLSARRPIRTTAADCEVRGGEYVAYDRANYASAFKVWLPKAQEGDAEAQNIVGQVFEKGLGQPADFKAALQWYTKAAEQGNAQAQLNLGHMYEKGLGTVADQAVADKWYRKASGLDSVGLPYTAAVTAAPLAVAAKPDTGEIEALRREAEASRQEAAALRSQLSQTQNQVVSQQEALRKAQDELEDTRLKIQQQQAAPAKPDDSARRQLDEELRQKQAQLQTQQAKLADMTSALNAESERVRQDAERSRAEASSLRGQLADAQQQLGGQQNALRQAQNELDATRRKIQQEKTAPAKADDSALIQLQEELRQKQAQLQAQQAKVAGITASLNKERQALKQERDNAKRQQVAATPTAAPAKPESTERNGLAQSQAALNDKINAYQQKSSELTAWLTGGGTERGKIDQRKQELAADARTITALREKVEQQQRMLADSGQAPLQLAAGPSIEILDPPVTLTRGMPSIQVNGGRLKELVGRISAADGLNTLIVNGQAQTVDASGVFRIPVNVAGPKTQVDIAATDKKNRRADLHVNLLSESEATQTAENLPAAKTDNGPRPKDIDFGQFYALIIGNADYKAYPGLKTPVNDAKSVELLLRERYGFKTKLLVNATRHQIMTALNEMNKRLTDKDNLLIYYAGHGEIDAATQSAYWLPTDAEVGNSANWISSQSITEYLSIMPARHVMVVADSCYSGAMTGSGVAKLPDGMDASKREKWLKVMNSRRARTVLTSGGVKPVLDQGGGEHSIFANAFLKVLRGNSRPVLEDYDIYRDVAGQVRTASAKVGFQQSPQYAPLQHAGHEGSPFFFVPEV